MIWINTATTVKRLHDRNRSGWWAAAVFVISRLSYVYYGLFFGLYFGVDISIAREMLLVLFAVALSLLQTWVVIELFFLIGTDGPNRFGADPTRNLPNSPIASRAEPAGVPDFLSPVRSPRRCHAADAAGSVGMDWTWYLFRFDGRINRAKFWLAIRSCLA